MQRTEVPNVVLRTRKQMMDGRRWTRDRLLVSAGVCFLLSVRVGFLLSVGVGFFAAGVRFFG